MTTPQAATTKTADEALVERARTALDDSAAALDYSSQLKLQRARSEALAQLAATPSNKRWWQANLLWLTAVPAALAVAVAIPLLLSIPNHSQSLLGIAQEDALQSFDDMTLLAADADLDTLADMEFYQWLAENPDASGA